MTIISRYFEADSSASFLICKNTMQYMITDAAPEAPDFANGLYLLSTNLGTTIGPAVCGLFITCLGTRYSVFGSLLFLIASAGFVALRIRTRQGRKQVKPESD